MTTKGPETKIVISYEKRRNRGGGVDDHSYVFVCGRNMMCEVVCLLCMREITVANRSVAVEYFKYHHNVSVTMHKR